MPTHQPEFGFILKILFYETTHRPLGTEMFYYKMLTLLEKRMEKYGHRLSVRYSTNSKVLSPSPNTIFERSLLKTALV